MAFGTCYKGANGVQKKTLSTSTWQGTGFNFFLKTDKNSADETTGGRRFHMHAAGKARPPWLKY
jgi:hypothetical protein